MKCRCGNILQENVKFCSECGQAAPKPEMQVGEKKVLEPIMTVEEVCALLKTSHMTINQLVAEEEDPLPFFHLTANAKGHKRFVTEEVLAWCKRRQEKQRK